MDRSMEIFLKEKREILEESELIVVFCASVVLLLLVPTIVVFTKYDKLLTMMKAQNTTDHESAAQYLQKHCIQPIQGFTGETDISHIVVSCEFLYCYYYSMLTVFLLAKQGQEMGQDDLINLTVNKVSQYFTPKMGAPSPVPVVTMMAQRISPGLKIEGSIR